MVETTMAEWRQILEVDLLSVVRGCRMFLPGMLAAGSGQIISTASFAGLAGAPGVMTYGVAKAAWLRSRSNCAPKWRARASGSA